MEAPAYVGHDERADVRAVGVAEEQHHDLAALIGEVVDAAVGRSQAQLGRVEPAQYGRVVPRFV